MRCDTERGAAVRGEEETWRRTRLTGFKLDAVQPFVPERDSRVAKQTDLPAAIQAELATLSTNAGAVVHRDADLLFSSLRPDLAAKGVIFCDLHTAVRQHPDLVQKYFMTQAVTLPDDDKFAALHAALWNGGTFLYVPRGVVIDTPLQGLIALDQAGVESKQSIIDAMTRPAEKVKPWFEYQAIFLTPRRISSGIDFFREHETKLREIALKTGVPAEVITAIIGVETFYGFMV